MAKPLLQYSYLAAVLLAVLGMGSVASAQTVSEYDEFGPVVRAYLGYLRNEQNVVDDRASRHEVNPDYYRRNSNRIRALRQIAVRIADESQNDYLPELEAVTVGEFRTLFDNPPNPRTLRVGEVFRATFRYLGSVRSGELFYVFARLDPYEQAELMGKVHHGAEAAGNPEGANPILRSRDVTRARRVNNPE